MSSASNHPESTPEHASSRRSSLLAIVVAAPLAVVALVLVTRGAPPEATSNAGRDFEAPVLDARGAAESNESARFGDDLTFVAATDREPAIGAVGGDVVAGVRGFAARFSGVVVDAGGRSVPRARVTALRVVDGRCGAEYYGEHGFSELDETDGLRVRTDDAGAFVVDGVEPGIEYDFFVDLQGEDLWWIESCAIPALRAAAPGEDLTLVLPYGLVIASVELPREFDLLRSEDVRFDVRLRVRRGPSDESVVGEVGDRLRIAVEFDRPIEICAEGTGLRSLAVRDVVVSRGLGRMEVPLALESTGLAHRLTVVVADPDGNPAPDVWVYEVVDADPPRFETLRSAGCSSRDDGRFVFEFLEARPHTIVAIPDADSGFAPAGSVVDLPPSSVRELQLDVTPGEFVEVRLASSAPRITVTGVEGLDLDFALGELVEWVESGRSSWERYDTFSPGCCYRTTFRLPVGRYQLRYSVDDEIRTAPFEVESGHRARLNLEFTR